MLKAFKPIFFPALGRSIGSVNVNNRADRIGRFQEKNPRNCASLTYIYIDQIKAIFKDLLILVIYYFGRNMFCYSQIDSYF